VAPSGNGGGPGLGSTSYQVTTQPVNPDPMSGYTRDQVQQLLSNLNQDKVAAAGDAHMSVSGALAQTAQNLIDHANVLSANWSGQAAQNAMTQFQQLHDTAISLSQASAQTGSVLQWLGRTILPYYAGYQLYQNDWVNNIESAFGYNAANTDAQQLMQRLNDRFVQANAALPPTVDKTPLPGSTNYGPPGTTSGLPNPGGGIPGGGPPGGRPPGGGGGLPGSGLPGTGQGGTVPGAPGAGTFPGAPGTGMPGSGLPGTGSGLPGSGLGPGSGMPLPGTTQTAGYTGPVPSGFGSIPGAGSGLSGAPGLTGGPGFGGPGAGGLTPVPALGGLPGGGLPGGGAFGGPKGAGLAGESGLGGPKGTGLSGEGAGGVNPEGAAAGDAAAAGAQDGAAAEGMNGFPMGGAGSGQGSEKERKRDAWMNEDDDIWGLNEVSAVPPVIGG
jgi:hypothetical protein